MLQIRHRGGLSLWGSVVSAIEVRRGEINGSDGGTRG